MSEQAVVEQKPVQKPWQQIMRDLSATGDPKLVQSALEMAILETDRAKAAIVRSREVTYDKNGMVCYRSHEALMSLGKWYAESDLVPDRFSTYRGKVLPGGALKDRAGDCAIAITMAKRWNLDPLFVMQGLFMVHGSPGVTGALATTVLVNSGKIKGRPWTVPILAEHGEILGYTAHVLDIDGREYSQECTFALARAEGWYKNDKWKTDPTGMCQHRSRSRLVRHDFPDVLGAGVYLVDELEDTFGVSAELPLGAGGDARLEVLSTPQVQPPTEIKVVSSVVHLPVDELEPEQDLEPDGDDDFQEEPEFVPPAPVVTKLELPPVKIATPAPAAVAPKPAVASVPANGGGSSVAEYARKMGLCKTANVITNLLRKAETDQQLTPEQVQKVRETAASRINDINAAHAA